MRLLSDYEIQAGSGGFDMDEAPTFQTVYGNGVTTSISTYYMQGMTVTFTDAMASNGSSTMMMSVADGSGKIGNSIITADPSGAQMYITGNDGTVIGQFTITPGSQLGSFTITPK